MCLHCESEKRGLWGPDKRGLELETIRNGNWISLQRCNGCGAYWVYAPYEPYAAFKYWVKWNFQPEDWVTIHNSDDGELLRQWHKQEIKKQWTTLTAEEIAAIQTHRKRSNGYYNPVDFPVEKEINIEKEIKST